MNSMIFTRTPIEKRRPVMSGNNNMGEHYSKETLPIKTLVNHNNYSNQSNHNRNNNSNSNNMFYTEQRFGDMSNDAVVSQHSVTKFSNSLKMNLKEKHNLNKKETQNVKFDNALRMNIDIEKKKVFTFVLNLNNQNPENSTDITNDNSIEQQIEKFKKSIITDMLRMLQMRPNLTIENVYQEKYGTVNASGIGDFLRGSYFLMQFCDRHQFQYVINMANHPISQFLEIYQDNPIMPLQQVGVFGKTNFYPVYLQDNVLSNSYNDDITDNLIYFLRHQPIEEDKIKAYIISYPDTPIDEKYKLEMQQLLKPTTEFSSIIQNTLNQLKLVTGQFIIIHIRYGDKFLVENEGNHANSKHFQIIAKTLLQIPPSENVLLIADNDMVKDIITRMLPFIKTHYNAITHTGEGMKLDTDKLRNTMLDFYLFSLAKRILAFSVYSHGTGFSKWVAETYSIPYVCRHLPTAKKSKA